MYNELYEVWKKELANSELQELPIQFYAHAADYLKHLREESRMLDKKMIRSRLMKIEHRNVKRMLHEIAGLRYGKILREMSQGRETPSLMLPEELDAYETLSSCSEKYHTFVKEVLRGRLSKSSTEQQNQTAVLRFIKDIPAIIGSDMKTYGPFKAEDVASVPLANSMGLTKQGLAQRIEVK
jgi:DNA replication factor GINS